MTISFTASENTVLFAGTAYSTENSAEAATEKAAKLNDAFTRVVADMMPEEEAAAKKPKPPATKANPDPDGDGDDDTNAKGDTDHDYFTPGGKKKK